MITETIKRGHRLCHRLAIVHTHTHTQTQTERQGQGVTNVLKPLKYSTSQRMAEDTRTEQNRTTQKKEMEYAAKGQREQGPDMGL